MSLIPESLAPESPLHRLATSRALPVVALLLAIGMGGWLGMDWWRQFSASPLTAAASREPTPPWATSALTLADARLFGGEAGAAVAPVVASDIRLKGVFAGTENRDSAAIVNVNGRDLHAAVGGEVLPGIKLVSVQPRSITVQRNGALQQVVLDEPQRAPAVTSAVAQAKPQSSVPVPAASGSAAPSAAGTAAPSSSARGLAEQRARRGEAYAPVGDVATEPAPAPPAAVPPASPIKAAPPLVPGNTPAPNTAPRSGVPATDLLAADALSRYGLQAGDLIQSVNGRPVASRMEVARLAAELRGQPVAVQIARGGEVLSVQFTSP